MYFHKYLFILKGCMTGGQKKKEAPSGCKKAEKAGCGSVLL